MKKLKIMVVDDSEDIRDLTTKWLTDEGHKVVTAVDGKDFVKKLDKSFNLVFLDIMMPGPSPKKILENVKKKAPKSLVVYLTAVEPFAVTPEQENKGWSPVLEPPVMGYLQKPITKEQVITKIKEAIKMHKVVGKK